MSPQHAKVKFNQNGTPISDTFDDIYFSDSDGLEETRYVFLQHNGLPVRWQNQLRQTFTIAETGFGTGLNFLTTWQLYNQIQHSDNNTPKLVFVTFEKFPLLKEDLIKAYQAFPELTTWTEQVLAQYPDQITGDLNLTFQHGQVELNIITGDVNERIGNLQLSKGVDAWYLDGFAPSKNPDMWTQHLFDHMARLANDDCTIATFTAAGFVRRGLIDAGFVMKKHKGFGFKREMIAGRISKDNLDD